MPRTAKRVQIATAPALVSREIRTVPAMARLLTLGAASFVGPGRRA